MLRPESLIERSPQGIAAEISRLAHDGTLAAGERLPTVRQVAAALGVSAGTVATAWRALADAGVIVSRGRAGSFIRSERPEWLSPRVQGLTTAADVRLDLSLGTPDPSMLPALDAAFSRVATRAETGSYQDEPVLPGLRDVLRERGVSPVHVVRNGTELSRVRAQRTIPPATTPSCAACTWGTWAAPRGSRPWSGRRRCSHARGFR